jgi:amidohydrolase
MQKDQLKEKIKSLSEKYFQEIVAVRRHLHTIPETGFEEYKTSEYILAKLKEYSIAYRQGIAKTGIVGTITGKNPKSKTIALRADMDALPINEANKVEYKSKTPGFMHACGHDVHMACLLGAAKILNELKNEFEGTVKLFFQPSEEKFPGGAQAMINEGVMEDQKVVNVIAQHVFPQVECGKIGIKAGKYMASTDEIYITVKGIGGHAATPELYINPLNIAATIILELEKEFNIHKPKDSLSTMAFGKIIGEGLTNIIPDEVKLEGTIRTYDEKWRAKAHRLVESLSTTIAKKMRGNCNVHIAKGYPMLVNDESMTGIVKKYAEDCLGKENVIDIEMRMTSEDFAYFAQKVPSVFYRLGVRNEAKKITSNLHTSTFNVDESCMITGTGLMAWIAVNQLK